jgi:GNAT superfamily N-acetyltransferase
LSIDIKVLRTGDEAVLAKVADDVFDHAVNHEATASYLRDPRLHLAVALDGAVVVAFASGVHYHHPDKPAPELFVNEIGVASDYRGRGLGTALLGALFERARELGCGEAWVLTDRANPAAMRLYASVGGVEAEQDPVMFSFRLDG